MWILLATPVGLLVVGQWTGMLWINLLTSGPTGPVNTISGLDGLAFLAVGASQLVRVDSLLRFSPAREWRWGVAALATALAAGGTVGGLFSGKLPEKAPVVAEAAHDQALDVNGIGAAQWLRVHATRGLVLVDDRSFHDLPRTGMDLHRVVAPFSQGWTSALRDPEKVRWAVVDPADPSDAVYRSLVAHHALGTLFWPVAEFAGSGSGSEFVVYENGGS